MDAILEFESGAGLEIIRWLQATYPGLSRPSLFITLLGSFEVYLILLPLIFWCINKRFGARFMVILAVTGFINSVLKHLLGTPRPFWLDSSVGLTEAGGFGMPSGHTQVAATLAFFIAYYFRKKRLWTLAPLYVILMAFSRIFLGVHFLTDVIAGALIGFAVVGGYALWERFAQERMQRLILGQKLIVAGLIPLVLLFGYWLLVRRFFNPSSIYPNLTTNAVSEVVETGVNMAALLFGAGIGLALERARVYFKVKDEINQQVVRYLIGVALLVVLWRGLALLFEMIFPIENELALLILRFIRYGVLGLFVTYYAPMLFVRFGLAQQAADSTLPMDVIKPLPEDDRTKVKR